MAKTVFGTRYDAHVSVVDGFLCSDITSFKFYPDIPSSYESYLNQQARKWESSPELWSQIKDQTHAEIFGI